MFLHNFGFKLQIYYLFFKKVKKAFFALVRLQIPHFPLHSLLCLPQQGGKDHSLPKEIAIHNSCLSAFDP